MSQGNILIVDDTPANLRLLSQMLSKQGYHVRPVPDGPLALSAVEAEFPDLILLDIRMREMDGYEVCRHLKADRKTCDIPIIFISALDAVQDKVTAFAAGGVDYVTKPFHADEVLARVATHLAIRDLQKQLQDANEQMSRELALAGEIQASFLPSEVPCMPGWQLSATLKPARQASGDFYDFIPLRDDRLGVVVADVTDKGAGAALYMALSCTLIRTYAEEYPTQPDLVFSAVNRRILKDTSAKQFVTVFYGVLDPATGMLVYGNAGHCPPLHIRAAACGDVQELVRTGMPLGIFEEQTWGCSTAQLDSADRLLLYTDGVTEAQNGEGELFGEERLLRSVKATFSPSGFQQSSARMIQDAILEDVRRFTGGAPRSDDIAMVTLTRLQHRNSSRAQLRCWGEQ
jgi:sigma-B regulation protein RsbU (phosphoserine phosphatase)